MKMLFSILCLFLATCCEAEEIHRIRLNGSVKLLSVTRETDKVLLWGLSRGINTSYVKVAGDIPRGTKIKAYGVPVTGSVEETLLDRKAYYPVQLMTDSKLREEHSECLPISLPEEEPEEKEVPEQYPEIESPVCDEIGEETLITLATQLGETFGGDWKKGNACSYLLTIAGDVWLDSDTWCEKLTDEQKELLKPFGLTCEEIELEPDNLKLRSNSFSYTGIFRKDACSKKKRYLFILTLDSKKAALSESETIWIRVREEKSIKREAALKPESEGRYSPRPILMMNWLGSTCGNKIDVVKWKRKKPGIIKKLSVYSLLSHRNMVLNLATVDSALIGGKGTAELYNGRESYGVCFKLKRERQNKNSFPF